MPSDYKELTNTELVQSIAQNSRDEYAWMEFYCRFHEHICLTIYKAYKRKGHHDQSNSCMEDLVQEVYKKLLDKNCEALRVFRGDWENSIYKYLQTISIRVVINYSRKAAAVTVRSIDQPISVFPDSRMTDLKDIVILNGWDEKIRLDELIEEIEFCLTEIFGVRRHKERDMLIFRQYLYQGLEVEQIASLPGFDLSAKTVWNIISNGKEGLRKCLSKRFA